ncbi:MAG TPA: hypothetical protein VGH77_06060 [Streptosporangiaceae bacterium]
MDPAGRDRPGQEMVKMGKSFLARVPFPVKLGVPVASGLLAAACGSAAATSAGSAPASGGPSNVSTTGTVIESHAGSGGAFLTDGSGRAVYLWAKDGMNMSACSGACASAWPPVMAKGHVTASGGAKAADLGTISRSGGKQVTYDGHALYYFAGDSGPGQTSGQGSDSFGAKWWLVAPAGTQITAADSATGASASTAPAAGAGSSSSSSSGTSWG